MPLARGVASRNLRRYGNRKGKAFPHIRRHSRRQRSVYFGTDILPIALSPMLPK
jgi:hypothetical protein